MPRRRPRDRRSDAASDRARSEGRRSADPRRRPCRRCASASSSSPLSRSVIPRFICARDAVWLERQRLSKDLDGLGEISALRQRRPEVRIGAAVLGVERDGLAKRRDGAGKVRLCEQRDAEPVVGFSRSGRDLDCTLERFAGAGEIVLLRVGDPEPQMQLRVSRITLDGGLEFTHRSGIRGLRLAARCCRPARCRSAVLPALGRQTYTESRDGQEDAEDGCEWRAPHDTNSSA